MNIIISEVKVYHQARILYEILSKAIKSAARCHETKMSFQMKVSFQMEIASIINGDLVETNLMGKLVEMLKPQFNTLYNPEMQLICLRQ